MKRPLLWVIVWFALGEYLTVSYSEGKIASVLVCTLAFCAFMGKYRRPISRFFLKIFRLPQNRYNIKQMEKWIGYVVLGLIFISIGMIRTLVYVGVRGDISNKIRGGCERGIKNEIGQDDEAGGKNGTRRDDEGGIKNGTGREDEKEIEIILDGKVVEVSDTKNEKGISYNVTIGGFGDYRAILYGADKYYKLGSKIRVKGKISEIAEAENPGDFDLKKYYMAHGICYCMMDFEVLDESIEYNYLKEGLRSLRKRCRNKIDMITDETVGGLYQGILLGEKNDINRRVKLGFQVVGIAHILAISGLHISMIASFIYKYLKKTGLNLYVAASFTLLVLFLYGTMTGFGVATIRAIIMMFLSMLGELLGRDYDILTGDGIALFILIVINPFRLYDGGMWLSIIAVVGCYIGQKLERRILNRFNIKFRNKLRLILNTVVSGFTISSSISLVTFPILLSQYYGFCPYSILVNVLIVPLMLVVVFLGITAVIIPWMIFAVRVISPGALVLKLYIRICNFVINLPGYYINTGKPKLSQIIIYYIMLTLIYLILFDKRMAKFVDKIGQVINSSSLVNKYVQGKNVSRCANIFTQEKDFSRCANKLAAGILLVGIILCSIIQLSNRGEKIIFLSVGQGDSAIIRTKDGTNILVDGGSSSRKNIGMYTIAANLKYEGMAYVDYCFISHMDLDHVNGVMEILEMSRLSGIQIDNLVFSRYIRSDEGLEEIFTYAKKADVNVIFMDYGDCIRDKGATISCIYPYEDKADFDKNQQSLALCYESDKYEIFFLGDMDVLAMEDMMERTTINMKNPTKTRIVKVSHHGSRTGASEEFYENVEADVAIISCQKNGRYGHPHKELLDVLIKNDATIMRTDLEGGIVF